MGHYTVFQPFAGLAQTTLFSNLRVAYAGCEVDVNPGFYPTDPTYHAGFTLTVKALGSTVATTFPIPNPGAFSGSGFYENSLGGTFTISGTLQDAFDYDDNTLSLRITETISPGTVLTCSVTFGGHTVTTSATVLTSNIQAVVGVTGHADMRYTSVPGSGLATGTEASITAGIVYSDGPAFTWGAPNLLIVPSPIIPSRSWTLDTTNGIYLKMYPSLYPGVGSTAADLYAYPGGGYDISGKLFAGKYDYPEPLSVDVIQNLATDNYAANPTFSGSNSSGIGYTSGVNWQISGDSTHPAISGAQSRVNDTISQATLRINTASLLAIDETLAEARRLWGYWKKYDAFNLTHAATFNYDPFASLTPADWTWAGLSGTVVSSVAGGMQIDATSSSTNPGTAKRTATSDDQQSWNGYRYIKIRVRSVGSASDPCILSVYTTARVSAARVIKRWNFRTGLDSAFVDIILDLCSPDIYGVYTEPLGSPTENVLPFPSYDGKESNYPLYTDDTAYWGASLVDWLKIQIPQGKVIEIASITGYRVTTPTVNMLYGSAYYQAQQHTTAVAHPSFRGVTDGRVSLEASDNNTSGGLNQFRTIQEIIDQINTLAPGTQNFWPGWAAIGSGPTDPFLNLARPSPFVGGAGVIYDSSTFTPYIDKGITGPTTIPAQVIFGSIQWYPGCGDVLGISGTSHGQNIVLRAAAVLRAFAHGITYDYQGRVLPGTTVTVTRADVVQAGGTGVSDGQGVYETGSPEGKGGKTYNVQPTLPAGNPPIIYSRTFQDQWMHRVVFRGGRVLQPIECDILSERVGYWLAYVDPSNGWLYADKYWHTDDPTLENHVLVDDTGKAKEPRLAANHFGGTLSVTYRKENDAFRVYSFDYGDTWNIDGDPYKAAISHAIELYMRRDGWRLFFYYDPADSFIKVDRYDPTNAYVDTVSVTDPVIADDCSFGVWEPMDDAVSYIQVAFLAAQIIKSMRSYDGGGTWIPVY